MNAPTLRLEGALSFREAPQALSRLSLEFARLIKEHPVPGQRVLLDLSGLQRADTSALALLLALHRQARVKDVQLIVQGAPQELLSLARLSSVDGLLGLA